MDAKPIEVIMRIDLAASNGAEIVAHAEKVSELVRCKDCKYRPTDPKGHNCGQDLEFPDDVCPCQVGDNWYSWMPDDNWFCASGERKEVDE